jgi:bis(5'-adenosyl)-triphosphatase
MMSVMENTIQCPFCSNEIQTSLFYSFENNLVIYNIAPVLPGHSLVIPKRHVTSIMELENQELTSFFVTARNALKILMKAFDTKAFDWSIQEKPEAGQTIEHLHLHIVPRITGDLKRPGDWYPLLHNNDDAVIDSINRPVINSEAMKQIVSELKLIASTIS